MRRCQRLIHQGEIPPKILQAFGATEERREIGRVDQDDVPRSLVIWRHPKETIELSFTTFGEGVWTIEINGLACEHPNRLGVLRR